jgi:N-formylglutamate deformylase
MAFRPKTYTDQAFIDGLKDGSLPPINFSHEAHVRLVWILAKVATGEELVQQVSKMIIHYANAIGHGDIYHETLTYAAVKIVEKRISRESNDDFTIFIKQNNDLLSDFKQLVALHYSPERLFSDKAKVEILPPDLQPF